MKARQRQTRSKFYVSSYNPRSGSFSSPNPIDEIFSQRLPYIFTLYGPIDEAIYLTTNENTEILTYESKDGGQNWSPYYEEQRYFDPNVRLDLQIVEGERYAAWIQRKAYQQVPVMFRTGLQDDVNLAPAQYVRSVPRLAHGDGIFHVVWESGQQNESWLTYLRSDTVPPITRIVQPTSPDILERTIPFIWTGEDNISSTDRLVYAFSIGNEPWSRPQSETTVTVKTPPDGEYEFKVRAEDVAGNIQEPVATFKFNSFKSAPDVKITQAPPSDRELNQRSVEVAFTGEDNSDSPTELMYAAQIDNSPWTNFARGTSHTYEHLSNGRHMLRVRMKDSQGNVDPTPAVCNVLIKVGLELILETKPPLTTNAFTTKFGWTAQNDKGQPVELICYYKLNHGEVVELKNTNQLEIPELQEGRHEIVVWGQDTSGDRTPEEKYSWLVDRTPPTTTASFTKTYSGKFPLISLEASDPALPDSMRTVTPNEFEYRINDGDWISFSHSGGNWAVEKSLSMLSWGYKIQIRSKDPAGNIDPNPPTIDLRIFARTNPYIFYSIAGVIVIVILFILKLFIGRSVKTRRRVPAATSSISTTSESEDKVDNSKDEFESSSYQFESDEEEKNDPYE